MPDGKVVSNRLKALRGGKSCEDVANALGISRSALSMYESGHRIPRDDVKVRIADYYGTTVQSIFFDEKCNGS